MLQYPSKRCSWRSDTTLQNKIINYIKHMIQHIKQTYLCIMSTIMATPETKRYNENGKCGAKIQCNPFEEQSTINLLNNSPTWDILGFFKLIFVFSVYILYMKDMVNNEPRRPWNALNSIIESEERRDFFENDCFAIKSKSKWINYDTFQF